jgi:hypothetical protein
VFLDKSLTKLALRLTLVRLQELLSDLHVLSSHEEVELIHKLHDLVTAALDGSERLPSWLVVLAVR